MRRRPEGGKMNLRLWRWQPFAVIANDLSDQPWLRWKRASICLI
jgi:hypothetical protein